MASLLHIIPLTFIAALALQSCEKKENRDARAKEPNQTMSEPYTPPSTPSFPKDYDGVMTVLAPYYQDQRPLDYFFEMYIVDVIEELPEATSHALADFSAKHSTFFEKHGGDWQTTVV